MSTTVLLLTTDATAQAIAVRVDAHGQVLSQRAASAPFEASARCVLVVPGVDVQLRWLTLPGRSTAQSIAAARLQLAEHLAVETQTLHVVIAETAEADGTRLVAAVESAVMQQWLARAAQLGVTPDAVVPDCLLLEPGADGADGADGAAAVMDWDGRWLIRAAGLACSLEPEAARMLLGERAPLQPPTSDPALAIACFARCATRTPINLRQHAFAAKPATLRMVTPRRLAALAALVLLSPLLLLLAQTLRYEIGARMLQSRAAAQLGVHDAAAVPAALQARRHAGAAVDTLALQLGSLFAAVDAIPAAELDQLDYQSAQPLRATLLHTDAASVQQLSARLAEAGWRLQPGTSQSEDDRLRTPFVLEPVR
ncbi:type II secretion system protein GspL [Xanthomonas hortorum pv. vitians]|uniref:GspL cytoplasmic actin-ATPase-like domain-containing protein n=1 Tax=Xanthomonas hortorum pv. vitians TaxID=83224 RepID=A0A6V7FCE7_9XANT|nr:type II secretion system protein GspL [Xanthomonas hortorum]APP86083.1 type II secretion system protein GspL [Xanthomonas hortorum pv. gardneri]MCE4281058.1 type II secretion system protein GspL [Xanthomonas hortorum pv. vitians]MCE4284221.1 type II secretion system protein GspL [Xanthomonas hortorum pv. vitians]MCE4289353.1 type II secretion system protein GspL [Xanthomonas hortorum pv. vitians]MCE4293301.1 type II secretion system protein GspL [Xanthomonas hortorum pv. vitians]